MITPSERRTGRYVAIRATAYCVVGAVAAFGSGGLVAAGSNSHVAGPCTPVAVQDAYSTPQDVQLVVGIPGVMSNDTPCGGIVSPHILPSHGTLSLHADGSFEYTPNPGYSGPDSFVYSLLSGPAAPPANVQITVEPAPVCSAEPLDDAYSTPFDTPLNVGLPGVKVNDTHCGYFVHLVSNPGHGTLTLNADGTFLYTPTAGFSGIDTFHYALAANMPGFANGSRRDMFGWRAPQGPPADNVATVTITIEGPPPTTTTTTTPPVTTSPPTTSPPTATLPATR